MSRKEKHGMRSHPMYSRWWSMISRCYNENNKRYKDYGGRGIDVYHEWCYDVKAFIEYVSALPGYGGRGLTLDRIRNNEGYKPGNLRWATSVEQANNKRNQNVFVFQDSVYEMPPPVSLADDYDIRMFVEGQENIKIKKDVS